MVFALNISLNTNGSNGKSAIAAADDHFGRSRGALYALDRSHNAHSVPDAMSAAAKVMALRQHVTLDAAKTVSSYAAPLISQPRVAPELTFDALTPPTARILVSQGYG